MKVIQVIHSLNSNDPLLQQIDFLFREDYKTNNYVLYKSHCRLFNRYVCDSLYSPSATQIVVYTNVWFD